MTKISYIMPTARIDYPYLGRPDLHLFEPTLESFKAQTMYDFEWVIVDALYEQRKDYFTNLKLPFKVKHVPALPNLWIEKGLAGISTQWNKGIIYADGELLFFIGDGYMMQPNFMEQLWKHYKDGYFPLAWYFYDDTTNLSAEISGPAPVSYDIAGYSGKNVILDFRYVEAFKGNDREIYPAGWNWWFGCSSASMEAILKVNGFDQNFDPDRLLLDCDVGSRLELAGYGIRFALFRDIYLIKARSIGLWNSSFKANVTIKCNYGLIEHSRRFKKYMANTTLLTDNDIRWIKEDYCPKHCTNTEHCKENTPWQYPFEHTSYPGYGCSKHWFNFWKEHQTLISLTEERNKRLNGNSKYQEGTFV